MRAYRSLAALLAATIAACSGGSTAGPAGPGDYSSPVGRFSLATVNGEQVPMLWDEMELWSGGPKLQAYWNGGSIEFRSDSTYSVEYRHSLTGPNLPGNVQQDTDAGTWRLAAGATIELHQPDGGVQYWQTTDLIYSVTRTTTVPALDGGTEQVTFVFVRD
jgi:hypothetical protein